jgi:hypothetical protein
MTQLSSSSSGLWAMNLSFFLRSEKKEIQCEPTRLFSSFSFEKKFVGLLVCLLLLVCWHWNSLLGGEWGGGLGEGGAGGGVCCVCTRLRQVLCWEREREKKKKPETRVKGSDFGRGALPCLGVDVFQKGKNFF